MALRTFRFRGKRIDDGEWIYGYLADVQEQFGYATINYVFDDGEEHWESCDFVDVNTVGQFIGLYDKHKTPIYDGDIICSFDSKGNKILHIVKYEESDAAFITFLVMDNGVLSRTGGIYSGWIAEFEKEVVGNIHDNKLEDIK